MLSASSDSARGGAGRLIATYLVLVFALSSFSYWAIIRAESMGANGSLFTLTLMWSPAVATLLTLLVHRRSICDLGWRLGKPKYLLIAYLLPLAYCAAVYVPTWLAVPGAFEPKVPAPAAGLAPNPLGYALVWGVIGIVQSLLFATGEEIGWRGFLVPQLARVTSFTKVAVISGAVWTVWHTPLVLFADYNNGAPPLYSLACFAVMAVGISFAFAWLTLASGSLWPAALLHASHNLFVQSIFDVMTGRAEVTKYVVGEFGFGLAIAAIVVAYVFWRMRRQVERAASWPVMTTG